MAEITMISIDKLNPHPDNPRKHIGDVTELAESIKANGILQNLTVVPYFSPVHKRVINGLYTVIIGHRRLAAARLAGLEELPCIITEMSVKEQLSTMLTENMQRSDLTVYEQAQGFQMMLDLGDTVENIADKSGFSESTVRRRIKLLELDHGKFERSVQRGGTLADYAALDDIKNIELKNSILDKIGTSDFKNALKAAIDKEKKEKRFAEWIEVLKTFAEERENINYQDYKYVRGYYNLQAEVVIPEDAGKVKYYYNVTPYSIDVYTDKTSVTASDIEREKEQAEREALQAPIKRRNEMIEEISRRHYELRIEFVQDLTIKPDHMPAIMRAAAESIYNGDEANGEVLADLCDIEFEDSDDDDIIEAARCEAPEKQLLYMVFAALDNPRIGYWYQSWNSEIRTYEIIHNRKNRIDVLYSLLCQLGYEMSGEELEMQEGTHNVFQSEE